MDLLGKLRRNLLGDDLPPAEKRAATVGTMGPGIASQMQEHGRTQRDLLGREGVGGMMRSPELARQSTDLAASLDLTGTFGGVKAKTADLGALAKAEALAKAGTDPADIWQQTGWFRGVDDKWRHEIDDSPSRIKTDVRDVSLGWSPTAPDVLSHPNLYAAYPHLGQTVVNPGSVSHGGAANYDELGNSIGISTKLDDRKQRSLLLHELQHGIQGQENFARGGSPKVLNVGTKEGQYAFKKAWEDLNRPASWDDWQAYGHDPDTGLTPRQTYEQHVAQKAKDAKRMPDVREQQLLAEFMYNRSAGEAEARAVQARRDLLPEQRRARPPWLDYDVPPEQQIVRGVR